MHTHKHSSSTKIVTNGLPFSVPMIAGLFCLTAVGATTYAVFTQPTNHADPQPTTFSPVTPQIAARSSYAHAIADSVPLTFTGILISRTDSHVLVEYKETTPQPFINPATEMHESVHRSAYVLARTDTETVFIDPIHTLTPGTTVSIHLRATTDKEQASSADMYALIHIQRTHHTDAS